jgi:hypothetical protein
VLWVLVEVSELASLHELTTALRAAGSEATFSYAPGSPSTDDRSSLASSTIRSSV